MAKIIPMKRPDVADAATRAAMTLRRLEGLEALEKEHAARQRVLEEERNARVEIEKVTVAMRRALDWMPAQIMVDIAKEVALEYELLRR